MDVNTINLFCFKRGMFPSLYLPTDNELKELIGTQSTTQEFDINAVNLLKDLGGHFFDVLLQDARIVAEQRTKAEEKRHPPAQRVSSGITITAADLIGILADFYDIQPMDLEMAPRLRPKPTPLHDTRVARVSEGHLPP